MKSIAALALTASMANMVAGHAIFQQLWVNGKDQADTCVRMPASNSPIQDPTSDDMRCNANAAKAASTCAVKAGDTVTVEMHQHNDRDCTKEAIGGAHHGPVMVYMSSVADAAAADGSEPFFKIFEAGYFPENNTWANDLVNEGCGKQSVVIPADIAPGDYLLRAETVALHAAGSANGAQYYMSCYQLTVEGSGSAKPAGVSFPGAYKATDPGLLINIYNKITNYVIPGPALYKSGSGSGSGSGSAPAASSPAAAAPTTLATKTATAAATSTAAAAATSSVAAAAPTAGADTGCKRRARKARRSADY
ncbi:hypothetical protein LY76DRAFT_676879 [Colletotrichum caudatum]|nr:hypothetical protein LY76DRAFT_676879 [Colletotrichum caudatum]